jgi:hypothetical protein
MTSAAKFLGEQSSRGPAYHDGAACKRGRPETTGDKTRRAICSRHARAAQITFRLRERLSISADQLITYAEALTQCHFRPETKFLNGDFCDRDRTERRR